LQGSGSFEAEDTHRDRKASVEAMRSTVAGHQFEAESSRPLWSRRSMTL
jgi:hypothetical protein